jgi:hypothetical protein
MVDNELLGYACEQFLGKSVIEIKSVILQTLEGHLRSILGRDLLTETQAAVQYFCVSNDFITIRSCYRTLSSLEIKCHVL